MMAELDFLAHDVSPVTLALSASSRLEPEQRNLLENLQNVRRPFSDGQTILREGNDVDHCMIVRSGWLARQRTCPNGRMVTVNVYLPGDIFGIHLGFARKALFEFVALTDGEYAVVEADRLKALTLEHRTIESALDWSAVRAFNIVSERVVSTSARSAVQRVLHLLMELWCRLVVVGQASDDSLYLPLNQREIGDMTGLSIVTVNRALKSLRRNGMISHSGSIIKFHDIRACFDFCFFDPDYLDIFRPNGVGEMGYFAS